MHLCLHLLAPDAQDGLCCCLHRSDLDSEYEVTSPPWILAWAYSPNGVSLQARNRQLGIISSAFSDLSYSHALYKEHQEGPVEDFTTLERHLHAQELGRLRTRFQQQAATAVKLSSTALTDPIAIPASVIAFVRHMCYLSRCDPDDPYPASSEIIKMVFALLNFEAHIFLTLLKADYVLPWLPKDLTAVLINLQLAMRDRLFSLHQQLAIPSYFSPQMACVFLQLPYEAALIRAQLHHCSCSLGVPVVPWKVGRLRDELERLDPNLAAELRSAGLYVEWADDMTASHRLLLPTERPRSRAPSPEEHLRQSSSPSPESVAAAIGVDADLMEVAADFAATADDIMEEDDELSEPELAEAQQQAADAAAAAAAAAAAPAAAVVVAAPIVQVFEQIQLIDMTSVSTSVFESSGSVDDGTGIRLVIPHCRMGGAADLEVQQTSLQEWDEGEIISPGVCEKFGGRNCYSPIHGWPWDRNRA